MLFSHSEVEELRLLLVGSFLGQTRFVQVSVRHAGLDRLGGRAVGEALGHVEVLQHGHVLQRGQSRSPGLLHLDGGDRQWRGATSGSHESHRVKYLTNQRHIHQTVATIVRISIISQYISLMSSTKTVTKSIR